MKTVKLLISSLALFTFNITSFANISESTVQINSSICVLSDLSLINSFEVEEIASYSLIEKGSASNIYEIKTVDGQVFYEVLSVVTLEALPIVAEYACIGLTKNAPVCKHVFRAGAAIIKIFENSLSPKIKKFWAAKVSGNQGFASLFTKNIEEAKSGQQAFEVSRNETGYPWESTELVDYRVWSKRAASY